MTKAQRDNIHAKTINKSNLNGAWLSAIKVAAEAAEDKQNPFAIVEDSRLIGSFQHTNNDRNGYQLDALMPLYGNSQQFVYLNPQVYEYDKFYKTYGIGLGYRQAVNNTVYGSYLFYDKQVSANSKRYDRGTVGVEALFQNWSVRLNYYHYGQPDKRTLVAKNTTSEGVSLVGNSINYNAQFTETFEEVYSGGNVELGMRLYNGLHGYVGYYSYGGVINGTSARLRYNLIDHISLGASTQYDKARGWLTAFTLSYWIGKHETADNSLFDRMRAPVVRDMTVAAYEKTIDSEVNQTLVNNIYFAAPGGTAGASGTQDSPTTIADAITRAGANGVVYIDYGDGSNIDMGGQQTLLANQLVTTSAKDLTVNVNGKTFTVIAGDAAKTPTLTGGGFLINNPASLTGFTLDGQGATQNIGIDIENVTGTVTLADLTVQNFSNGTDAGIGIEIDNAARVDLNNVSSNSNDSNGLAVGRVDNKLGAQVNIVGGEYSNNGVYGVYVEGDNDTNTQVSLNQVTVSGNSIGGVTAHKGAQVVINDSSITSGAGSTAALWTVNTGSKITVNNSDIISQGFAAAYTQTGASNIIINQPNTLQGNLYVLQQNSEITVTIGDNPPIVATFDDFDWTCNVTNGSGSCTLN